MKNVLFFNISLKKQDMIKKKQINKRKYKKNLILIIMKNKKQKYFEIAMFILTKQILSTNPLLSDTMEKLS